MKFVEILFWMVTIVLPQLLNVNCVYVFLTKSDFYNLPTRVISLHSNIKKIKCYEFIRVEKVSIATELIKLWWFYAHQR